MINNVVVSSVSRLLPSEPVNNPHPSQKCRFNSTGFETRSVLGKKGTRSMDKLTGLAIHCIDKIMSVVDAQRDAEPDRIGIVVGSAQGSMDSIVRFTYESLAHGRSDFVNPALFPNTVMNCAAGQSAIWHKMKGPNATISCGELSSIAAINYAMTLLGNNYADTLITGAVEELTEVSMSANNKTAENLDIDLSFSEAGVFFVLENRTTSEKYQRDILVELKAVKMGFNSLPNDISLLKDLAFDAINVADILPSDIDYLSIAGAWPQTREVERQIVRQYFKDVDPEKIFETYVEYGNAVSAHNSLQLSDMISHIGKGEHGLIIAQDIKGNIGTIVVKGVRQ